MSRFDNINLSQLPAPEVIEQLNFEAYLADFKADFVAACLAEGIDYDVSMLESDPIILVLEVASQRETKLRGRVNDGGRAVMLAHSKRSDLDGLGALYALRRDVVAPATPTTPVVMEDDERYRGRVQGSPEAFSSCGPFGAYVHFAKRADVTVKDVRVFTLPGTGEVHVLPLVSDGDGTPSPAVIERVNAACRDDAAAPLTDIPIVRSPIVRDYAIRLKLIIKRGPDRSALIAAAMARVDAYARARHLVGEVVYLNGITSAAQVGGVETVIAESPTSDLVPAIDEAFFCTSVDITSEVIA